MKPILIFSLFLFSCSNSNEKPIHSQKEESSQTITKREVLNEELSEQYNFQSDPKAVVEEVFNAANTKDYSNLALMLDPQGQSDDPTTNICNVGKATKERELEFIEYFKLGRVIGEPVINGNTAEVQIKFGPDGTKDETFFLVQRNGLWYLGSI
jgi:hypothetical protein